MFILFFLFISLVSNIYANPEITDILQKIENYPCQNIRTRFQREYEINSDEAKIIEQEWKRWMILASKNSKPMPMLSKKVDQFWHTFILDTKKYKHFCNQIFNKFINHTPIDKKEPITEEQWQNFEQQYTHLFNTQPNSTIWVKKSYCSNLCCDDCTD